MRKYQPTEYDIIFTFRGKKWRIYANSPLWGILMCGGAFLMVFGFIGMYILAFLVAGV